MEGERLAYSLHETAARLGGISVRSVQRLIASGALKAVRVGRRVLVPALISASLFFVSFSAASAAVPGRAEPGTAWMYTRTDTAWMYTRTETAWMYTRTDTAWMYAFTHRNMSA